VDITVTAVGRDFSDLARDAGRALRTANRTAGREIQRSGRAAMNKGAPRMFGRKLTVKGKVDSSPARATVTFIPAPRTSGGWAIRESGADAHIIRPRRRKALAFNGRFAMHAAHPGMGGDKAWTKAGTRLDKAVRPVIDDVYGDALADA
jgi:hypothetical protein